MIMIIIVITITIYANTMMEKPDPALSSQTPIAAVTQGNNDSDVARVDSQRLLGAHGKVIINHQGQQYQLRQTKSGKLILTK